MYRSHAPICLIAYRRPDHFMQCLAALQSCHGAEESELLVFVDSPRSPDDAGPVRAVIDLARTTSGFARVQVHARENHLGMAGSVMSAVDYVLQRYGRAIVVEDDLSVARGFLTYMNAALERYANEARVMGVSGHLMDELAGVGGSLAFLARRPSCWGWGTWLRSWRLLDRSRERLLERIDSNGLRPFLDPPGCLSMTRKLRDGIEGRDNSWSPMWFASVALAEGLFVYPPATLVVNNGFDGSGEHGLCTLAYASERMAEEASIGFPAVVEELLGTDDAFVAAFRAAHSRRWRDETR